jgi:hypothetical protein
MPGLSYDLKFDKTKGENDKIFIDNEITIVEKIILFSWNCFRILWRNKRKRICFNNQMQPEHVVVENHSHFSTKLKS